VHGFQEATVRELVKAGEAARRGQLYVNLLEVLIRSGKNFGDLCTMETLAWDMSEVVNQRQRLLTAEVKEELDAAVAGTALDSLDDKEGGDA
jgi:hypothetical protein